MSAEEVPVTVRDEVIAGVEDVLDADWSVRNGTVIPETDDVVLKNGAVRVDATYVYADLADSSTLGHQVDAEIAGKVIRAYLNAASRILRNYGGAIRSFDGDRVMAIYIGKSKNTDAARAALALNWAVDFVLAPTLKTKWPDLRDAWTTKHGVGIDTGEALLVRGGVRDNNDLVSIGSAPNVAAKLSALRCADLHITDRVHDRLAESSKMSSDGSESRWTTHDRIEVGGVNHRVYWSNYRWKP